ncbi:MAG: thiamine pyrophosphate-binding protein [Gemmataceae bacterium]|nr:thiamine pyrophosphate-binding protein [Gemmataceae bacterium]
MMARTGADMLVEALYRQGVRLIFGMPGSHTTAIYDAIVRHGGIGTVLCRNEQAGAFMADGYARVTGRPGVICTTAGPGATNALTGIAEAFGDSIPVLLIAGQVNHDKLGRETGSYHEIDLENIFRPCTCYTATARRVADVPQLVLQSFAAMTRGRRRSAALFFPQDLLAGTTTAVHVEDQPPSGRSPISSAALDVAADLLRSARRPIILAGGGAVWSDAGPEIRALAQRLSCPVITSLNGKGIIDERDPLSLGHARSVRSKAALPHADAMIAVGCRFTEVMTWFWKLAVPRRLIQIDLDPGVIGVNYPVECAIVGDAKEALAGLLERIAESSSQWGELWDNARGLRPPRPEWLIETLRAELPENGVVVTDACEMALRMHTDWPAYAPRTFFYPSTFIALGWGLPAAIGAAVALPDRPIVCLAGDGGFVMTCQELATAARYRLRLIIIVHNDHAYGAIKNLQRKQHGERYIDVELNNPDFVRLAEAFDIPGARTYRADDFATAVRHALKREGPSLIEVPDTWRSLRA